MKSNLSKEEKKKRTDKDVLAGKTMVEEGGAIYKDRKNDPRINSEESSIKKDKKDKK